MNKNATQNREQEFLFEDFDLREIGELLSAQLEAEFSELSFLEEEREKIGSPDNLGKVVMNVAWEQLMNNISATAGEDFIEDNRGLTLDLRDEAHIQTTENFTEGKIATHNDKIDFQKRFDEWQDHFQKNEDGTIKTNADNPKYSENKPDQKILKNDARKPFDKNRIKGSKTVAKDHTIPVAGIKRDPEANAHLEIQEQVTFANSDKNLGDLDAAANSSKGDLPMTEWLDKEKAGQKPADRFPIDEEELRERDRVAQEEYARIKEEGKQKSIKTGKQSQKEEALRISNKALRSVVMRLLAELLKEIVKNLISWFRTAKKSLNTFLESIKAAIINFVSNLKKHLFNAGTTILTTVATAIFGPIVRTVQRAVTMLKQGVKSLGEAISYLKNPLNQKKSTPILLLEIGKIVVTGASAVGTLVLGDAIEKGLMTIPVFAFEIPLLGSLASLVGLLLSGLIMGIIGAIVLYFIDKLIAKKHRADSTKVIIEKNNAINHIQQRQITVAKIQVKKAKAAVSDEIKERHGYVRAFIEKNLESLAGNAENDIPESTGIISENTAALLQMQKDLEDLL